MDNIQSLSIWRTVSWCGDDSPDETFVTKRSGVAEDEIFLYTYYGGARNTASDSVLSRSKSETDLSCMSNTSKRSDKRRRQRATVTYIRREYPAQPEGIAVTERVITNVQYQLYELTAEESSSMPGNVCEWDLNCTLDDDIDERFLHLSRGKDLLFSTGIEEEPNPLVNSDMSLERASSSNGIEEINGDNPLAAEDVNPSVLDDFFDWDSFLRD